MHFLCVNLPMFLCKCVNVSIFLSKFINNILQHTLEIYELYTECHKHVCMHGHKTYRSFSSDVTAAILVYQNNEMVYGTGISSFLFKYFVLFHHPTGATDHVSENDLYCNTFCLWKHHVNK